MSATLPNAPRWRPWLVRWVRRVKARWAAPGVQFIYSRLYSTHLGREVDPRRGEHILAYLANEGWVRRTEVSWPRRASMAQLARVHSPEYLEGLREPGAVTRAVGWEMTAAEADRFVEIQRAMVGGTLLASRTALVTGGVAINLGGGLHHAHADRGQGFCLFNDVAIAIRTCRLHGFTGRVLVIDLDLHDGDGTRVLFADDPTVHTFSIHNQTWDARPAVESTVVELGAGVEDAAYLAAIERHLPPVVERFRPQLVFYLAGTDPSRGDLLGNWQVSSAGLMARDQRVMATLRRTLGAAPMVVLLAGGYGPEAWRFSARFFAWLLTGDVVEPPSSYELTLDRMRATANLMGPPELTGEALAAADRSFGLTEADILGALEAVPADHRFLGYYSESGVELALERLGLLLAIRKRGFRHPLVELDSAGATGQTVRVVNEEVPGERELLAELRARRDRGALPGMELLRIEWLMLQNPREHFAAGREALPGQEHPGLGLLRETVAVLVLICERLSLDGLLFVPAHYHLMVQGGRALAFVDPVAAARFAALRQALSGLPLAIATRAVAQGEVIDTVTGEPVLWQPSPAVMPVSARLRAHLESPAYREAVQAAGAGKRFVWRKALSEVSAVRDSPRGG